MTRTAIAPSGVARMVPARPHVARQVQQILAVVRAATAGDPTALEQLAVIESLLAIRATADLRDREAGAEAASPRATSAVATITHHPTIERAAA